MHFEMDSHWIKPYTRLQMKSCVLNTALVMGGMCCNFTEAFDFVDPELLLQNNIAYYCVSLFNHKIKKNTVFRQKPLIVVHWCEIVPVWLSLFNSIACYHVLLY